MDPEPDTAPGADEPAMPTWVKVGIAILVIVMLVLVVGKLAGIEHGPGLHG